MTADASPFPRRPIPVLGESLYGFERRFASCTRFKSLGAFRHATRLFDLGPRSRPAQFERLAVLAGQPPDALEHMCWNASDASKSRQVISFLGHEVRMAYLRMGRLCFCPNCLAEDGASEQRIHRQAWQILQVSACPHHRTLLVDTCDKCGEPFQHIRKTKAWACACGQEMTRIATPPAPDGAVVMSLMFMRRLGIEAALGRNQPNCDGELPAPFEVLSLDDLLTISAKIGVLAATSVSEDEPIGPKHKVYRGVAIVPTISIEEAARMMDVAYRIIGGWPQSAHALFSSIADRNPNPDLQQPVHRIFATRIGHRLLGRLKSVNGSMIHVLDDALKDWLLQERGVYMNGQRRAKVGCNGDVTIDVADALRRIEGRSIYPMVIRSWEAAGAIKMVGRKVLLSSVNRTVDAITRLPYHKFDDGMAVEEWSISVSFTSLYRRSDALHDIFSGRIRVQRDPREGRFGLATLRICRADFMDRAREAGGTAAEFRPRKMTRQEAKSRRLPERVRKARESDSFRQPGKLNSLLAEIWPQLEPLNFATYPTVRCKYVVRQYRGRNCPMRLYSLVDAINLVAEVCGPFEE